ncbi:MAG: YciI family protein [Rubrivivax sp.]
MQRMPAYMLLIVEPLGQRAERSEAEGHAAYAAMQDYAGRLRERGVLRGVESLQAAATRVQQRDGRMQAVDGPFAEAKEMVGGFFVVDVASREDALALAAECPAAAWCTVEVRALGPCYT